MQLETYIKDLLYRYECVIVPGFGAFLAQYRSARIDEDSYTFYPPGKTVSFNKQLQTNDGLLATYVASVESCSYELALQKIRNFAGSLSVKLEGGKTISLDQIGEFHMNAEQSVQFVPSEGENFNTASFGLTSFVSQAVNRDLVKEPAKAEEPLLFTPRKRVQRPYLKYAAVALVAISVTGFASLKIYEGQVQKHNFVEKQRANTLVENQIQEATFVIENPLSAVNLSVPKTSGKYHIVAGAFRIEDNAHRKIRQLTAKGYAPSLIGQNRYGLHQVVYSSHEDRLEALRSLRTIKRSENPDAWLLVQDLNK